jgi:hypothetical protein
MRIIILTIAISSFAACNLSGVTGVVAPQKIDSLAGRVDTPVYAGVSHCLWPGDYETYRSQNGSLFGSFGINDTVLVSGAWYISGRRRKFNVEIDNPQKTKIIGGQKVFVEYIKELGATRITNYKNNITVLNDRRKIKVCKNETLIINDEGGCVTFYNGYAGVDSTWLTSPIMGLTNVGWPVAFCRLADRYDCKIHFNTPPYNYKSVKDLEGSLDCNEKLHDNLKILQSVVDVKFSFDIKDQVVNVYMDSNSK